MGGEGKTAFGLHFKVKFANMNKVNYQKILEQTIEKNERALALLEKNKEAFSASNMQIIPGPAPEACRRCYCTVAVHRAVPIVWNIFQIILK